MSVHKGCTREINTHGRLHVNKRKKRVGIRSVGIEAFALGRLQGCTEQCNERLQQSKVAVNLPEGQMNYLPTPTKKNKNKNKKEERMEERTIAVSSQESKPTIGMPVKRKKEIPLNAAQK